ncbi:hypothetical protein Bca4012_077109 [Brassica carinata]
MLHLGDGCYITYIIPTRLHQVIMDVTSDRGLRPMSPSGNRAQRKAEMAIASRTLRQRRLEIPIKQWTEMTDALTRTTASP